MSDDLKHGLLALEADLKADVAALLARRRALAGDLSPHCGPRPIVKAGKRDIRPSRPPSRVF